MSIRFQADNDLKRIIVDATLRSEPRMDFQTAQAARLHDLDDEAVLRLPSISKGICHPLAAPASGTRPSFMEN